VLDARAGDAARLSNAERDRTYVQHRLDATDAQVADLTRRLAVSDEAAASAQTSAELERQAGSDTARLLPTARRELSELAGELQSERARADGLLEAQVSASSTAAPEAAALPQAAAAEVDEMRRALEAARADVAAVQHRLAALEAARTTAEESAVDAQARAHTIERERDAMSLALDTERMMNADLRAALATAAKDDPERRLAAAPLAPVPSSSAVPDGEDESAEMELTFEEDDQATEEALHTLDEEGWESVRTATRYRFKTRVDVNVNNQPATLADLSVGGCGVISRKALETSARVRVQLPDDPQPLICMGTVVWVRKEQPAYTSTLLYRAGVQFTQADQAAIEAFIIMRADV